MARKTSAKRKKPVNGFSAFANTLERKLFSANEQQGFLEDFATLVEDGVPANKAIEVVQRISKGSIHSLCNHIMQKIAQGRPIADGLVGWMPQHIIELVRAGETGGTLGQNIRVAAESLNKKNEVVSALFSALTYPVVVLITGISVMIYMKGSVFAQFAQIKPIEEWPETGQRLMAMATFFESWWWLLVGILVVLIVTATKILTNYVGPGRSIIDSIPLLSIYRSSEAARFMETLGLLIINGIVFKQALQILHSKASPYLSWHLMQMGRRLSRGSSNIADVLDTGMVKESDVIRLRAIADAKGFEHALVRLGQFSAAQNVKTLQKTAKIIGGVILALGAGLAVMMVFGIYNVGSSLS